MEPTTEAITAEAKAPAHAGYRVIIEPRAERIRAVFNGVTVADSARAMIMHETRLPCVYYFPREDVRMDLMRPSDHRTHCPFRGNASYWSLDVDGRAAENAVWSYEEPFDESSIVGGYIAFDWDEIDTWLADEEEIEEQPRDKTPVKSNPFVDWLLREAWKAKSSRELVAELAGALVAADMPLARLRLLIRTLHPQLFALAYTWQRGEDEVTRFEATHERTQTSEFLDSPFAPIINGEGGIRRRLEGPNPRLDFPILKDLVAEGATDYVAMPLRFSDGQINILVLVSDRPGGFSTDDLGQLYEVLPTLSRILEAHAQRVSALSLLKTYLGANAGERVLHGLVRRGDGEELHAVIWMSDLRGSTALAAALSRDDYLGVLNQFFDSVAGAVIEHGGEVLKFIGDAVLAIFPIDDPATPCPEASARALEAARDAEARIKALNAERTAGGEPALAFGIGLHRGTLTYGNIGTARRLDFTVIGQAVNEAARIEALSKALGKPVLVSAAFAESIPGALVSLGKHTLRGTDTEQEIFALPEECEG